VGAVRALQLFGKFPISKVRTPRSRILVKLSAGMIAVVSSLALGSAVPASAAAPSEIGPVQVIPGVSGLSAVSCNANDFCVAVGTGADGGEVLPITDGTPGTLQVVTGSDQDLSDLSLSSVSCTGASSCVAAGSAWAPYIAGLKQEVGVLVPITDGIPQGEVTIEGQGTPGMADYVTLSAVSCYVSSCVAVGTDNDMGPIILPFSAAETVAPIDGGYFNGIACHGDGACVSVGDFGTYVSDGYSGMLPIDNSIAGHGKTIDASTAVACRWSLTCIAVGSESIDGSTESVGDVVTITKRSPGTGQMVTGTSELDSAACAGPKYCITAGSNSSNEGVLVTIAGSRIKSTDEVDGSTGLGSVACSSVAFCIAIGGNSDGQTVLTTFGLPPS
jgi:hypothetical protein